MIGILNYGLGNIRAFYNIYKSVNIPCKIINDSKELCDVEKIILPGVGAFDFAMNQFKQSGFENVVEKMVIKDGIPLLGVCVGMQMLANKSDEGLLDGLGWIDAQVKKIKISEEFNNYILPHMGWNNIEFKKESPLFYNFNEKSSRFYFLHSYYFKCNNETNSISNTNYGFKFTSAVNLNNIYGVQFHPEKSHNNGINLLYNFAKL